MLFRKNKEKLCDRTDEETIKACLFGFFIGDALGVPVEFLTRSSFKQNKITDMEEYGTHNQPKGTWSDDSSMVLATIDGLLKGQAPNINYQLIMNNFLQWKLKGDFTPFDCVFDIGISTSSALSTYQQHIMNNHPEDVMCGSGEIYSNGNGSLMRILPISLYLHYLGIDSNSQCFMNVIKIISSMTHSHVYSVLGCYIYSLYVSELLKGHDKYKAYKNIQIILKNICMEYPEYKDIDKVYGRIVDEDISKLKEESIKSSGYVVDSLEAAIWSVLTSRSFEEAVLKAINLGEDTDTIGALTGGLAGIIFGYDSIPQKWISSLQKRDYLENEVNLFIDYLKKLAINTDSLDINKNESNDLSVNNRIDIKLLEDTIYDLENNPEACTTYGGGTIGDYIIKESNPGEQLTKFIEYMYENNLLDKLYPENYPKIKNKEIEECTYEEVLTCLTKIIRGDRFISGELYNCVKRGVMLRLVKKLYDLVK